MLPGRSQRARPPRRGVSLVVAGQLACTGLVAGWFATANPSAPDDGLLQLDVLSLSERVEGVTAVDGRPTMVVLTCPASRPVPRALDPAYGLVVSTDGELARRVALPLAARCEDGYVLVDGDGLVRYRSYDPGWQRHSQEQEVLLGHLDAHA